MVFFNKKFALSTMCSLAICTQLWQQTSNQCTQEAQLINLLCKITTLDLWIKGLSFVLDYFIPGVKI